MSDGASGEPLDPADASSERPPDDRAGGAPSDAPGGEPPDEHPSGARSGGASGEPLDDPADASSERPLDHSTGDLPADPAATTGGESDHPIAEERPNALRRFREWWGGEPAVTPRQRARTRAIHRGTLAGTAMILIGSVVTLPLLILSPGPTYNTIGEVDGQPMIEISGTTTFPTKGNLDMTTVAERGGSTGGVHLGEALVGWAVDTGKVVPRETVYGPETTGAEVTQRNDQLFALSKSDAIAAAMGELGIPTQESVVVTMVSGGAPADGIVQAGDVIVAVDGTKVTVPAQVGDAVRAHEVGETVTLEVMRTPDSGGERKPVTLEVVTAANPQLAAANPDAAPVPYLGILVGTQYEAPFEIDFTLQHVGGPSAGMMFSLAIVDMLTKGAMTGGGHVAGTGTISPDGTVGAIGGIQQKLQGAANSGAQLFLAPETNCDEVVGHEPDGLTVVPVSTLSDARDVVEAWAGDHSATFPTCEAALEPAK